jgi:hypothetical protein
MEEQLLAFLAYLIGEVAGSLHLSPRDSTSAVPTPAEPGARFATADYILNFGLKLGVGTVIEQRVSSWEADAGQSSVQLSRSERDHSRRSTPWPFGFCQTLPGAMFHGTVIQ